MKEFGRGMETSENDSTPMGIKTFALSIVIGLVTTVAILSIVWFL